MGECKCCNDLGSSPKYQLFVTICTAVLVILLGVYGISITSMKNAETYDTWAVAFDLYTTSQSAAYFAGFLMSIV